MRIISNTTSPFARVARIALGEKGFDLGATEMVNPWADAPSLLAVNPAAKVPAVTLDSGRTLTESLLVVLWLERTRPEPSLLGDDPDRVIAQAGLAMGVIEAMANIVTGVMQMDPQFATSKVGLRRRRSVVTGLRALEAEPPSHGGGVPSLAVITTAVALDYLKLRFAGEDWVEPTPRLSALVAGVAERPAFKGTQPYIPG